MTPQPIIGLEIHIELKTKSKMFCGCKNDPDERHPNFNICPICLGHPGTLPVINKEAVWKVIKTGLALGSEIPEYSKFDRKNYFYPDLPKGYQISQFDMPLCKGGFLMVGDKKIRIRRVHLEEDTGRLIHPEGKNYSLVDFNRAGIPLMELVTEPDLKFPQEAREFAYELQLILRYLDVSEANMEKGQMRIEGNISLKGGLRAEIKNLNSLRSIEKALEFEIEKQTEMIKSGKKVIQETRGWDENREVTFSQREKEEAHDYRYFPEPDLPILHFTQKEIEEIKSGISELPQQKRERFREEYHLPEKEIEFFVFSKDLGEYFEKAISELRNWIKEAEMKTEISEKELQRLIQLAANYLLTDLQGLLRGASVRGEDFLITPENFAEFVTMIYKGKISSKIAKIVLGEMFQTGADPSHIIQEKGLELIADTAEIENIVKIVLQKNQKAIEDYKKGKEGVLQFLIGEVMRESRERASPQSITTILKKLIS
mgnify:CR=1 FL=1